MSDEDETYQIVTANLLRGGGIVYLTLADGKAGWSESIHDAHVFAAAQAAEMIALAEKDVAGNIVVGAYPVEITGNYEPLSARERIRAKGPSVAFGDDAVAANKSGYQI